MTDRNPASDAHLRRANTCLSECAETNHPGREHVQWAAERFAEARAITGRVEEHLDAAKVLAAVMDPDAFQDHPIERRREAAALQWAARRFIATEHADRLLRSDQFGASLIAIITPAVECQNYAENGIPLTPSTRVLPPEVP